MIEESNETLLSLVAQARRTTVDEVKPAVKEFIQKGNLADAYALDTRRRRRDKGVAMVNGRITQAIIEVSGQR